MTLADYLATEQARKNLLIADVKTLPRASELHGQCFSVVIEHTEAWWRCRVMVGSESVTAYYRPDGDRYIVTDLGEGVRALRIKGCALLDVKHKVDDALMQMYQAGLLHANYGPVALIQGEVGTIGNVTAVELPDAICRVMLASLKVAGVGR